MSNLSDFLPFGKFKGVPIGEVPENYLRWLLTKPDLRPGVRRMADMELGRRATIAAATARTSHRTPEAALTTPELPLPTEMRALEVPVASTESVGPAEWEDVTDMHGDCTTRLSVPGGWLYRVDSWSDDTRAVAVALCFVPDPLRG